jgi:subtilisin family serine protease
MGGVFSSLSLLGQTTSNSNSNLPNKLVVRLNHKLLDYSMIDNPNLFKGSIGTFLNNDGKKVLQELNTSNDNFSELKIHKIFTHLKTSDSISISRTGDLVYMPPFWATFHFEVPKSMNYLKFSKLLKEAYPLIIFVDLPMLLENHDIPNDSLFSYQESLYSFNFPEGHINIDSAWNIETGKRFIKVGVLDSGIDTIHPDLNPLTGFAYFDDFDFPYGTDYWGHGTSVSGIIGATRNNGIGVSGIAGGDGTDTSGVSLIDLNFGNGTAEYVAMSLIDGSRKVGSYQDWTGNPITNPDNDYYFSNASGFGIHIANHSYGFNVYTSVEGGKELPPEPLDSIELIEYISDCNLCREAFLFSLQNGVVNIVSRGNLLDTLTTSNLNLPKGTMPQIFDDSWIVTVGASGTDGKRLFSPINGSPNEAFQSPIGMNIDIIAPGTKALVTTTKRLSYFPSTGYSSFNGTSASAPHVSGVAALLLSYYNKPCYSNINLDPADVEFILQESARHVNDYVTGYDDSTGFGLLDAHEALKMIKFPEYQIVHPNEYLVDFNLLDQDTIHINLDKPLFESYNGPLGSQFPLQLEQNYIVERRKYKTRYSIDQYMLPGTTLINSWVRHSRTNSLGLINDTVGSLEQVGTSPQYLWISRPDTFRIEPMAQIINILNDSIIELEGYYYHFIGKYIGDLIDENNIDVDNPVDYWYPINPEIDSIKMAFSIYLHNPFAIDRFDFPCDSSNALLDSLLQTTNLSWNEMEIYPNPGENVFNVRIKNQIDDGELLIFDLAGKLLYTKQINQDSKIVEVRVNDFKEGLYLVSLQDKQGNRLIKRWVRL